MITRGSFLFLWIVPISREISHMYYVFFKYICRLIVSLDFLSFDLLNLSVCFSQALPCWNVQFSSGGSLLVGTCENSKFASNMSFNNWLIQRLHFFNLSSAIAFFVCFVNLRKARYYPWSYCSTLSIVLHHKSYLFFFFQMGKRELLH